MDHIEPVNRSRTPACALKSGRLNLRRSGFLPKQPDSWSWNGDFSDKEIRQLGATSLVLWQRAPAWVHRKVETLTLLNETVVRRHLSVDFTLPAKLPPLRTTRQDEPIHYVPLAMLQRKVGPMHFDVRDESGRSLPLLNETANGAITGIALYSYANQIAKSRRKVLDPEIENVLAHIPLLPYADAVPLLRSLLNRNSEHWRQLRAGAEVREALQAVDGFVELLSLCAANTFALVPVVGEAGLRRVIKISYDEEVENKNAFASIRRRDRLLIDAGWKATPVAVLIPDIGGAESHHIQVCTPPNVELTGALLEGHNPRFSIHRDVFDEAPSARPAVYSHYEQGFVTRAHLYLSRPHNNASGLVQIGLRAERRGFSTWSVAAAIIITALLAVYWKRADELVKDATAAGSVLLLVPGLIAAYVARPGEHALARKLLRLPRMTLVLTSFVAFAAAGVLRLFAPQSTQTINLPVNPIGSVTLQLEQAVMSAERWQENTLYWLFIVSLVATFVMFINRLLPRPSKRMSTSLNGSNSSQSPGSSAQGD